VNTNSTLNIPELTVIDSPTYGLPLDAEQEAAVVDGFLRDGAAILRGVMTDQAPELRAVMDRQFEDPRIQESHVVDGITLARAFELDPAFKDLLVLEPIISVVEAILGRDCHMTSQNFLRTAPGRAIDTWHVDDSVYFPLPEHMPQHLITPPPILIHAFVLLSDVLEESHGPTQLVPGSHLSGRQPAADLMHAGRGPISIFGRAGDVYLHHNQTWHRGAPNTSSRTRYVMSTAYGRRWASQRLWPSGDYRVPSHVTDGAGERLLRVLGRHPRGPYA
jgi:hypothetical protein